jgi:hypothetical protein
MNKFVSFKEYNEKKKILIINKVFFFKKRQVFINNIFNQKLILKNIILEKINQQYALQNYLYLFNFLIFYLKFLYKFIKDGSLHFFLLFQNFFYKIKNFILFYLDFLIYKFKLIKKIILIFLIKKLNINFVNLYIEVEVSLKNKLNFLNFKNNIMFFIKNSGFFLHFFFRIIKKNLIEKFFALKSFLFKFLSINNSITFLIKNKFQFFLLNLKNLLLKYKLLLLLIKNKVLVNYDYDEFENKKLTLNLQENLKNSFIEKTYYFFFNVIIKKIKDYKKILNNNNKYDYFDPIKNSLFNFLNVNYLKFNTYLQEVVFKNKNKTTNIILNYWIPRKKKFQKKKSKKRVLTFGFYDIRNQLLDQLNYTGYIKENSLKIKNRLRFLGEKINIRKRLILLKQKKQIKIASLNKEKIKSLKEKIKLISKILRKKFLGYKILKNKIKYYRKKKFKDFILFIKKKIKKNKKYKFFKFFNFLNILNKIKKIIKKRLKKQKFKNKNYIFKIINKQIKICKLKNNNKLIFFKQIKEKIKERKKNKKKKIKKKKILRFKRFYKKKYLNIKKKYILPYVFKNKINNDFASYHYNKRLIFEEENIFQNEINNDFAGYHLKKKKKISLKKKFIKTKNKKKIKILKKKKNILKIKKKLRYFNYIKGTNKKRVFLKNLYKNFKKTFNKDNKDDPNLLKDITIKSEKIKKSQQTLLKKLSNFLFEQSKNYKKKKIQII